MGGGVHLAVAAHVCSACRALVRISHVVGTRGAHVALVFVGKERKPIRPHVRSSSGIAVSNAHAAFAHGGKLSRRAPNSAKLESYFGKLIWKAELES